MAYRKENKRKADVAFAGGAFEPMIELISDREAVIEGCAGIVEYNDSFVSVNCKKMIIAFDGSDITLKALSSDIIEVTGKFSRISFSRL